MRYTPKHAAQAAPRPRKPRTLRSRILVGLVSFALAIGGGVAFAAILNQAQMKGTVKGGTFEALWTTAASTTKNGAFTTSGDKIGDFSISTGGTPSSSLILGTGLPGSGPLPIPDLFPTDYLQVSHSVAIKAPRNAYVSSLKVPAAWPAGLKAELTTGCGQMVMKGTDPMTLGAPTPVVVKITATGDLPAAGVALDGLAVEVTPMAGTTAPAGVTCPTVPAA